MGLVTIIIPNKPTVPVSLPQPLQAIVAVKVTAWPKVDGFSEDCSDVVVEIFEITWLKAGEVLPIKLLSPP